MLGLLPFLSHATKGALHLDHTWVGRLRRVLSLHRSVVEDLSSVRELERLRGARSIGRICCVAAKDVRFRGESGACRRPSFHKVCVVGLSSVEAITRGRGHLLSVASLSRGALSTGGSYALLTSESIDLQVLLGG